MAYIDSINKNSTDYTLSSFGNIIYNTQNANVNKTINFPNGYSINDNDSSNNLTFRVLFKNGHQGQSNMTLNGKPIYVNKQGTLTQLPYHNINSTYKSLQPNTILEMYYTSDITGGAFVIVGNPIVLSGENYTIYADGYNVMEKVYPVGSVYQNATSNTNPSTLFGIGTWKQITDKFIMARGTTYTTSGGSSTVTLAVCHLPSHCHSFTPSGTISVTTNPTFTGSSATTTSISSSTVTINDPGHSHGLSMYCQKRGGDNDINNITPNGTSSTESATTGITATHNHTHTFTAIGSISGGAYCFTGTCANTNNIGSDCAFSIIPPYCAVYTWYRCA